MAGLNRIDVIGNLGRDPEMSYLPTGKAVTKFSVAVTRTWNTAEGEKKEATQWFNVAAWEKLAEVCNTYLHKGSKVWLSGRMESRDYTDKEQVKRTAWEIRLLDMQMLDPRQEGSGSGNKGSAGGYPSDEWGDLGNLG